jgi:ornithine--oxo-acid transaminase
MTRENPRERKVVRLSSKTKGLLEIDSKHSAGGVFPLPVFIKSGKGSILKVCTSSSFYGVIGEMTEN